MGGGDQGAQQAHQNLAGLLLLPRRHRPRIRHRRLLLRGPTARLNFPDCVPEYCHQDLSAAAIRKKATEDVVLYCKCFRKKGIISYNINNLNLEENKSRPPLLKSSPRDRVGASSLVRPNVPDAQIRFDSGNLSFDELDFSLQAVEAGDFSGLDDPVVDSFFNFLPGVSDLEDGLQLPELHLDHLDSASDLGDVEADDEFGGGAYIVAAFIGEEQRVAGGECPDTITDDDLKTTFSEYGVITRAVVMRDADGKSKCFGFVNFEQADDAAKAVNGKKFDEKEWVLVKCHAIISLRKLRDALIPG
ncbi:hypothetical protein SASPL_134526 [Salvia splendens]|uniref:RRM domain-containing protein n=1 Tax=Salvia splendens TaxID=180675 RepID=A0A8X8X687_SALSN|nr:hypothetical protein SASPL_134526 [Salvia splendens]